MWVPEAEDAEAPDQQEQVPLDRVLRIVETVYGQRQDKEHNPHGEHAHDVWQVGRAGYGYLACKLARQESSNLLLFPTKSQNGAAP